jgi:hypothetical protein
MCVCVCVRVCVRMYVCMCVCVCVRYRDSILQINVRSSTVISPSLAPLASSLTRLVLKNERQTSLSIGGLCSELR